MSSPPGVDDARLAALRELRRLSQLAEARALAQALYDDAALDDGTRVEAGWHLAFCCLRLGELDALLAVGEPLLARLQAPAHAQWRHELLRWMAIGACELGRFELALRCAQDCHAQAQAAGDPKWIVPALTAVGACFERMGDPWQAERLMNDALAIARDGGGSYERLVTLNNLCAVTIGMFYLLRDAADASEAHGALQRSLRHAREAMDCVDELPEPAFRVIVEGNLGEVLVHLGQAEEAGALLERALASATRHGLRAQAWRIRCTEGERLLQLGRDDDAHRAMDALLAGIGDADQPATLLRVHHAMYRACRALGRVDEALQHHERYERLSRRRAIGQLQAQSRLLVTRLEAEQARRDAQHEQRRAAEAEAHALLDELTGLGNRRFLERHLPALAQRAGERRAPLAMALIDLDHFKDVNDRFGHGCGDRVLVAVAQMLRDHVRASDLVVRLGGEEFLLVLPDAAPERAREVCERLRQCVAAHDWAALAPGLQVTASVGLAHAPPHGVDDLYEAADRAMYAAKRAGRDRVVAH